MTPKEKAKELVIKKYGCSKRDALIAVDEIMNSWHPVNIYCGHEFHHDNLTRSFYKYWEQVKNEIKKL
jgi:hypothetical protein